MEEQLHQQGGVIPEWVMAIIEAPFRIIKGKGKHEDDLKYFCVDCCGHPLTKSQMKDQHYGHKVLRAYTCSRAYTFRIHDVYGLQSRGLDVSGVAPFKINSGLVFYRQSPRHLEEYQNKYGVDGLCFTCGRGLTHAGFFCSILCKLLFSPPPQHSDDSIQISMSIFEQNKLFRCSVLKKKIGAKKKPVKKNNRKIKDEEKRGDLNLSFLKGKHGGAGVGIKKTESSEANFVEENQCLGCSVADCKKKNRKTINKKEGELKAEETSNEKQERCSALRKRKQIADDGINKMETIGVFVEDNRVAADPVSDQSKKKMKRTDNKDSQLKSEERRSHKVKLSSVQVMPLVLVMMTA